MRAPFCFLGPKPVAPADLFWQKKTVAATWPATDGAGLVWLAATGKYWRIGGWDNGIGQFPGPVTTTNEVWSSPDLITWTQALAFVASPPTSGAGARFRRRHYAGVFLHTDPSTGTEYIYVCGGDHLDSSATEFTGAPSNGYASDVWRSSDGTTWTRMSASQSNGWAGRTLSVSGSFNGALWVVGGQNGLLGEATSTIHNDVWTSTDMGATWTQVAADLPNGSLARWVPRGVIQKLVSFNGLMWLVGGGTYDTTDRPAPRIYYNDAWSTPDGVTWTKHIKPGSGKTAAARFLRSTVVAGTVFQESTTAAALANATTINSYLAAGSITTLRFSPTATATTSAPVPAVNAAAAGMGWRDSAAEDAVNSITWDTVNWTVRLRLSTSAASQSCLSTVIVYRMSGGVSTEMGRGTATTTLTTAVQSVNHLIPITKGLLFTPGDLIQVEVYTTTLTTGTPTAPAGATTITCTIEESDVNGGSKTTPATYGIALPWPAREYNMVEVWAGRLWMGAGYDGTSNRNDVWSSTDGDTWFSHGAGPFQKSHADAFAASPTGLAFAINNGVFTDNVKSTYLMTNSPAPTNTPTRANLECWYESDHVIQDGGFMIQWPDLSGNCRNLVCKDTGGVWTGAPRYFATDAIFANAASIGTSSTADEALQLVTTSSAPGFSIPEPHTVYQVLSKITGGVTNNVYFRFGTAGATTGAPTMFGAAAVGTLRVYDSLAVGTMNDSNGAAHVTCATYVTAAGSAGYIDSATTAAFTGGTAGGDAFTSMLTGTAVGEASRYRQCAILIFSGVHSAATRLAWMQYLANKYGVTLT